MKILSILLLISSFSYADQCIENASDIVEKIKCLKVSKVVEITDDKSPAGTRQFDIQIIQQADHQDPSLGTFDQRVVLTHRGEKEPMVLQTGGYAIFKVAESVLAKTFGANQLQVEHRFFANSTPSNKDWSKLNIRQSADDFHFITEEFKKIYTERWVGTGASKGGMTSVYHRYFYPADLDGTVADVAPLSFSNSDQRYSAFLQQVGGETYKDCREKLARVQMEVLKNRDPLVQKIQGNFTQLKGSDVAFEHMVIESFFYFWQYGNPDGCATIPDRGTPEEMYAFLDKSNPVSGYTDEGLSKYTSYFYQAATELGGPDNLTSHIEKLRRYLFSLDQYIPSGVSVSYSNISMREVDRWLRNDADQILLIYGEFDPWTAGAMPESETGKLVKRFNVPKGNHGSKFYLLAEPEKTMATEIISTWLNKKPMTAIDPKQMKRSLDSYEFKTQQGLRF